MRGENRRCRNATEAPAAVAPGSPRRCAPRDDGHGAARLAMTAPHRHREEPRSGDAAIQGPRGACRAHGSRRGRQDAARDRICARHGADNSALLMARADNPSTLAGEPRRVRQREGARPQGTGSAAGLGEGRGRAALARGSSDLADDPRQRRRRRRPRRGRRSAGAADRRACRHHRARTELSGERARARTRRARRGRCDGVSHGSHARQAGARRPTIRNKRARWRTNSAAWRSDWSRRAPISPPSPGRQLCRLSEAVARQQGEGAQMVRSQIDGLRPGEGPGGDLGDVGPSSESRKPPNARTSRHAGARPGFQFADRRRCSRRGRGH